MSLTYLNNLLQLTWNQQQPDVGFGALSNNNSFQSTKNFTIETYGINSIYLETFTIGIGSTETIDLTALTDVFSNALNFTRVYGIQISTDVDVSITPSVTDPCTWFFLSNSSGIVLKGTSAFNYSTSYPFVVSSGATNIDINNLSGVSAATVKVAIWGGTGTPPPTATPSPTVAPTGTPIPTATPLPTPMATSMP